MESDNERLCAMEPCLQFEKYLPLAGLKLGTACSEKYLPPAGLKLGTARSAGQYFTC